MTTILVTGGGGFIGRYTIAALRNRGYKTLSFERSWHYGSIRSEDEDMILGDIRDATAVNEAMAHADGWIHLAGVLGTQETIENPLPAAETNVLGGLNVLEAATQYKLPGVCIAVGNHWMNNTYSITKTTIERFCQMYRDDRGLDVTVVRALNAYGPGQSIAAPFGPSKVRKIMPAFICRALTGQPIEIYGSGDQVMDMIYVENVADILVRALEYTAGYFPVRHVIEAGTGRRTTVKDIASEVIKAVGHGEITHLPMRPGEPEHSVVIADVETLDILAGDGYTSFTPLEIGVPKTVEWFRNVWLPTYQRESA